MKVFTIRSVGVFKFPDPKFPTEPFSCTWAFIQLVASVSLVYKPWESWLVWSNECFFITPFSSVRQYVGSKKLFVFSREFESRWWDSLSDLLVTVLWAIARNLVTFSGNGSNNGQKPGKTFRPKNLGSKFFQISRAMAQSPGRIFRAFAKTGLFPEATKRH